MSFNPIVNNPNQWKLDKIGQLISPLDVVQGGNLNMHAVQQGMYYAAADGKVQIDTLDAALICPESHACFSLIILLLRLPEVCM